jgi:hypothetical protein
MRPARARTLKQLRERIKDELQILAQRDQTIADRTLQRDIKEQKLDLLEKQLYLNKQITENFFSRTLDFLPHNTAHLDLLEEFQKGGSFEESVFIMTKYPNSNRAKWTEKDVQLDRVIEATKKSISDAQFRPRLASDWDYHKQVWPNIELYLLGCKRAVAIVEDEYIDELNPNVALEWGWMRALNRDVKYLVKEGFEKGRADTEGFLRAEFPWDNPEAKIEEEIRKWLKGPAPANGA